MVNDKIEAFRQRLHSVKPKQERAKIRDWIALTASLVALALSTISTYVTVLVQRERLEGIILRNIEMFFHDKSFTAKGQIQLLFTNRGNMPLTVAGGTFRVVQSTDQSADCDLAEDVGEERDLRLDPFVIKPAEAVIKTIDFDHKSIGVKALKFKDYYFASGCLRIDTITTNGRGSIDQWMGYWSFEVNGKPPLDNYPIGSVERFPFTIVDRAGSIFFPLE